MLSFAAYFWPLFWMITGGAALVTVVLSLLVATFSPAWFGSRQRHQPSRTPVELAGHRAGHDYRDRREAKAA